jgi:hypothetical protein
MLHWTRIALLFLAGVGIATAPALSSRAVAQILVPKDAQFVFLLDVQAIQHSKVGQKLIGLAKQAAEEELKNHGVSDGDQNPYLQLSDALGFDPLTEVKSLVITSADFEHPEHSMTACLHLGKSIGNLEGLFLSLPNYESDTRGQHVIHSAQPDDTRIFAAIHEKKDGNHVMLLAPDRALLDTQLASLDVLDGSSSALQLFQSDSVTKPMIAAQVLKLPLEELGDGPQKNIAKRLKSLSFAVSEQDGELDLRLQLETETPKQAEQIRQMVQGFMAMLEFAQSMESEDEDLKQAIALLKDSKASVDGSNVRLRFGIPSDWIEQAIQEEVKSQVQERRAKPRVRTEL